MMGRIVRTPEIRTTQGNNPMTIANFSLAVDRKYKKDGEATADFFNCTSFGKQAEFVEKYLKQGTKVVVSGRLQQDSYTNKDGQKVYSIKIITEEVEFAESKSKAGENKADSDGFMSIPDGIQEELPFN